MHTHTLLVIIRVHKEAFIIFVIVVVLWVYFIIMLMF